MNGDSSDMGHIDALSYIDKEYEHEMVQEAVHALISEEMHKFTPSKAQYLAHLPYPKLKFANSPALQTEWHRVEKGLPAEKLDTKRYNVEKPEPALESDVQAWRKAVSNAKAQLEHQTNRLMNLEIAEKHLSEVWLQQNRALEGMQALCANSRESFRRDVDKVNYDRRKAQENISSTLTKLQSRRDEATWKCWQIEFRCRELESQLPADTLAEVKSILLAERNDAEKGELVVDEEEEERRKRQRLEDDIA